MHFKGGANVSKSEKSQYTKIEIILEIISVLALLTFFIFTYSNWPGVPERIPDHFNMSGMPDSWGVKGKIPIMIYVTVFVFILFSIISRFPRMINFPIPIKENNLKSHLQLRFSLIMWTKAELVIITSYLGIQAIRVSLSQAEGLGAYIVPIILLVIIGTAVIFIYRASRL